MRIVDVSDAVFGSEGHKAIYTGGHISAVWLLATSARDTAEPADDKQDVNPVPVRQISTALCSARFALSTAYTGRHGAVNAHIATEQIHTRTL